MAPSTKLCVFAVRIREKIKSKSINGVTHSQCIHTIAVNNFRFIFDIALEMLEINVHYGCWLAVRLSPYRITLCVVCTMHKTQWPTSFLILLKFHDEANFLQENNKKKTYATNTSLEFGPFHSIAYSCVCVCVRCSILTIFHGKSCFALTVWHTQSILSVINKVVDNNFLSNSSYFECESRDWYLLSLAITTCTTDGSSKHMLWINI